MPPHDNDLDLWSAGVVVISPPPSAKAGRHMAYGIWRDETNGTSSSPARLVIGIRFVCLCSVLGCFAVSSSSVGLVPERRQSPCGNKLKS